MEICANSSPKTSLNESEIAVAGAFAGGLTRALCQPFDVLKIRFQLQSAGRKYTSISQALYNITKEEGVAALWKGHVPAQTLSISFGLLQFSTWEYISKICKNYEDIILGKEIVSFGAGATSGVVATVCTFPFDVIRTRLVAQTHTDKTYEGFLHAIRFIYKHEGISTFYKGLTPTLIQAVPYAGSQFMFYRLFSEIYDKWFEKIVPDQHVFQEQLNITLSKSVVSGSLAGLCAKIVVYPLDLAKKRMQIQGMREWIFKKHKFVCRGLVSCIIQTTKNEGFTGLYKGLLVSSIKAFVVSGLQFTFYDVTCLLINISKTGLSYNFFLLL
ncbi:mitochondrial thiamine pyrophosphate carrier-like [Chrysoperla carnea]|uniref:mitochondrial thiamine pyrophosphate carrier-like n=1 Tax=Chrysoperla carnea TaxID=189513 RepID=UPI001D084035|nr:mitochondrial thiamine pyrophosphate carrier-like [Chrysoperla carnea]